MLTLLTFAEDYRMEQKAVPTPGFGEVLVKVEAVGICAGDSKCFDGASRFWGKVISTANFTLINLSSFCTMELYSII